MNETQSESLQESVNPVPASGMARRRLLRAGLAATPVILTLSGRSAMAAVGDACEKGLSPLAWNSLAPDGTNCKMNSHTVTKNTLGQTPVYWDGATSGSGIGGTAFNSIFTSSSNTTKIHQILNASTTSLNAFYVTAYCNAVTYPATYAITLDELKALYATKKLVPTATFTLTDTQIAAFLAQTWGA